MWVSLSEGTAEELTAVADAITPTPLELPAHLGLARSVAGWPVGGYSVVPGMRAGYDEFMSLCPERVRDGRTNISETPQSLGCITVSLRRDRQTPTFDWLTFLRPGEVMTVDRPGDDPMVVVLDADRQVAVTFLGNGRTAAVGLPMWGGVSDVTRHLPLLATAALSE